MGGVGHGLLLLSVLWWAWVGFARLTNVVDPEEGGVRMMLLAAIGAMLILSLAAPRAFGRDALTFAIAYLAVRGLHVALSGFVGHAKIALRRETIRLIPHTAVCGALLAAAPFLGSRGQLACWIAVAAISYAGPLLGHGEGWQISPPHFVERFGQIILIALGESVVAIGIGAQGLALDAGVITAALLGMAAVACLWWAYFDWVIYLARAHLTDAPPSERAALARDGYAYPHSPVVAGIMLFAFGLRTALHDTGHHLPRRWRSSLLPAD